MERYLQPELRASRVDREAGIIYGVKILGLESRNGRRYTLESIRSAVSRYEGARVNVNHPKQPTDQRDAQDRLGVLENVRAEPDGLYGDLRLLKSHRMAAPVMEAAESMPTAYALSHNADGRGITDPQGVFVVQEIAVVRSVDLVADGATNQSLFEGVNSIAKITFQALLEAMSCNAKLPAKKRKILLEMCGHTPEADMPVDPGMSAEMDAPAEDADPMDALKSGFEAAVMAVVSDDSMDAAAKVKRIGELLKAHEKLTTEAGGDAEVEVVEEGEEEEEKDDEKKKEDAMEGLKLKRENHALRLCMESAIVLPSSIFAAVSMLEEKEQKAAIAEWKKASVKPVTESVQPQFPRSQNRIQQVAIQEAKVESTADFLKLLTGVSSQN